MKIIELYPKIALHVDYVNVRKSILTKLL